MVQFRWWRTDYGIAEDEMAWSLFSETVGAALTGVIIVTGLTFTALSLSKRGTSSSKQQMEPLTTQQEISLASDNEDNKVEEDKSQESNVKPNNSSLESKTGITMDLSSSSELFKATDENKFGENEKIATVDNAVYTARNETIDNVFLEEDLQHGSAFDDKLVAPDETWCSPDLLDPVMIHPSESASEDAQNFANGEPVELSNETNHETENQGALPDSEVRENSDSSNSTVLEPPEPLVVSILASSQFDATSEPQAISENDRQSVPSVSTEENPELSKTPQVSIERNSSPVEVNHINDTGPFGVASLSPSVNAIASKQDPIANNESNISTSLFEPSITGSSFASAGIPAPSVVSAAMQVLPGKVLVPAVVDQVQGQALAALQILKVIEADVQSSDLCTRREYARWMVAASSALSRSMVSKIYPAMYIEDVTELAFDDITPDDPDFSSIQGLAESGLISSKLSTQDLLSSPGDQPSPFYFFPESPLSRQDLVTWKMALEKKQLPQADRKMLYQVSGFRDIDKINANAWPALVADLSSGDQGIISLAFGCTRLFQPDKPVTKAQAAVALATGEASDVVSEEIARIEAESMAENAVSAHNALVAEVERDINASFEKELSVEREKINAVERMAEEARCELERLRAEREQENIDLTKERAAIESELEVLSHLRREVEEQLHGLMSNKVEISYEKERITKLQREAENEKQEISRLQYELKVERKALSMARAWAEDEAKRAREQAKALEEARDHWERQGIKVIVDSNLQEESSAGVTWLTAAEQFSVEGTASRAENLVDKLKLFASDIKGKSREVIDKVIQKILYIIKILREWAIGAGTQAKELQDGAILKMRGSIPELHQNTVDFSMALKERARRSIEELQQASAEFTSAIKEGSRRVAGDCREGVEKLTQKFKP
uniref:SLH domain-containing protein n=1 Tax=Rhizophora mucronata TaxID=61149 RepID=A0A2P2KP53_RHIMU